MQNHGNSWWGTNGSENALGKAPVVPMAISRKSLWKALRPVRKTAQTALAPGEAGAGWAAFHAFRHTFASIHLSEGTDIVAVSRALGHHSPAFTLSRYAHLLPGELAPPLDLEVALPMGTENDQRSAL